MQPETVFTHEFVEFIPAPLQPGTLYVSIRFGTATHLCACGCGNKVVTPLRPTDWKLIYDGKSVSLDPSIGNWSFECRSHYWIKNNRIRWADQWSKEKIEAGRAQDSRAKDRYYKAPDAEPMPPPAKLEIDAATPDKSIWQKLKNWWGA